MTAVDLQDERTIVTLSKIEILESTIGFMEMLLDETLDHSDADWAKGKIFQFKFDLQQFNADPSVSESRPFLLMKAGSDEPLSDSAIDSIIRVAQDNDLQDEFCKFHAAGRVWGFFSHKVLPLVEELATNHIAIAYGNSQSNALILPDYQFVAFFNASQERIAKGLEDAKACLAFCQAASLVSAPGQESRSRQ